MRQNIIPSCLLTIYMYDSFKSILLPVNFSKGVFDFNQHCVDFRLVIFFFSHECNIPSKEDTNTIFLFFCALCYQMPHKLNFLYEVGCMLLSITKSHVNQRDKALSYQLWNGNGTQTNF